MSTSQADWDALPPRRRERPAKGAADDLRLTGRFAEAVPHPTPWLYDDS